MGHLHVIIFTAPAPEFVGESIDSLKLFLSERTYTAKNILIRQPGSGWRLVTSS